MQGALEERQGVRGAAVVQGADSEVILQGGVRRLRQLRAKIKRFGERGLRRLHGALQQLRERHLGMQLGQRRRARC